MLSLYLREYTTTGRVVDNATSGNQPGRRPETIPVKITYIDSTVDELVVSFGDINDTAPNITLTRHTTRQIVNGVPKPTTSLSLTEGTLIRTDEADPYTLEEQFPVKVQPVELPGRPAGLELQIGEDEYEGATLQFTPGQTEDLLTLFGEFVNGPLEDNLHKPILTPSHVDETGTLKEF